MKIFILSILTVQLFSAEYLADKSKAYIQKLDLQKCNRFLDSNQTKIYDMCVQTVLNKKGI